MHKKDNADSIVIDYLRKSTGSYVWGTKVCICSNIYLCCCR